MGRSHDANKAATEAAVWLARIERGLQAQEGEQLRQWLQHGAQRELIVEAAKLYHGPDIVAVLAALVPVGFGNPPPPKYKKPPTVAIVVGLFLVLFMVGFPVLMIRHIRAVQVGAHSSSQHLLGPDEQTYNTAATEIRSIKLPDDNDIVLNGRSQLWVLYAAWTRQARVAQGEAIFEVTRQWPTPFLIVAGGRHFEARPSRFDIRVLGAQSVELTVLEGSVTVKGLPYHRPTTPAEARDFDPSVFADAVVGPMQSALIDEGILSRQSLTAADVKARLGWQPQPVLYVVSAPEN